MYRNLCLLLTGLCANVFMCLPALAQTKPEISLTRFADCGTPQAPTEVNQRFSDIYAYGGLKIQFTFSCYLIKHGDRYLLWDTGHSLRAPLVAPKTSLVDQLAQLGLKPEQIQFVGISHYHADHTGQVDSFPQATLLIGKGDWDAVASPKPAPGVNAAPFAHWVSGDGSVMILGTPGHTPGHRSLMVRLNDMGNVLISGDLIHFRENYETSGVPWFNVSRSDTLASIDRFKKMAAHHKATVIIQHDARDVSKLPAFPASAK